MAWCRPGDKPLSEPKMVRLPTHICVTRPQWVNTLWTRSIRAHSCIFTYHFIYIHYFCDWQHWFRYTFSINSDNDVTADLSVLKITTAVFHPMDHIGWKMFQYILCNLLHGICTVWKISTWVFWKICTWILRILIYSMWNWSPLRSLVCS